MKIDAALFPSSIWVTSMHLIDVWIGSRGDNTRECRKLDSMLVSFRETSISGACTHLVSIFSPKSRSLVSSMKFADSVHVPNCIVRRKKNFPANNPKKKNFCRSTRTATMFYNLNVQLGEHHCSVFSGDKKVSSAGKFFRKRVCWPQYLASILKTCWTEMWECFSIESRQFSRFHSNLGIEIRFQISPGEAIQVDE